jgi:hypothetical protein
MKSFRHIALPCLAVVGTLLLVSTADAKSCVKAGGQGTGLTPDIAKAMATAALGNSITQYGGKAAGKASMTCKTDMVITTCNASQRACK